MTDTNKRQQQAKWLRLFRKWHRLTGALLFAFFLVVGLTGLMLGWKKHSGDLLLAKSRQGISTDLRDWLSLDSLHSRAILYLRDSVSDQLDTWVDRIDVRKDKGMVKFTFKKHYVGLQIDGATGDLLYIEQRRADFIEQVHDGSIVDRWVGTSSDQIKLGYTTIMGLALLLFAVTGFWLWYGPKRMRKHNK